MGDAPTVEPVAVPQQSEVPINENPVNAPTPMSSVPDTGSPETYKPSQARTPSRQEAIQAAFERAAHPERAKPKSEPRAAPKAAEAKPGHNKPPEPTEKEEFNLRKRPDDVPRGERGRFAPRAKPETAGQAGGESGQVEASPGQTAATKPRYAPLPANAPFREHVPRMSEAAKADWDGTPEAVRADVHRIVGEFTKAYQVWKPDLEAMKPIKKFHEMAVAHGTTLERALTNYTGMEQKLRSDLVGGLDLIVNNLGLKTADGAPITLRDVCYHVLTQTPEQLRQTQMGNQQQAASQHIGALMQQIAGLQATVEQLHNERQFEKTRGALDGFADDGRHPRFDELGPTIERELKLGFDLETAYRRAELLHPATTAAQTRNTSAQTRDTTDRSISGAPSSRGSSAVNGFKPTEKAVGRRDAIGNAIRHVLGA